MRYLLHSKGRGAMALVLGATLLLAAAAPAAASPARPLLGKAAGTDTLVPLMQPIPECPDGTMFWVTENGTGNLAHLGLVRYTLHQCAAADMATGEGWTLAGWITIVAANGDRLLLSHHMTFTATPMPVPKTCIGGIDWVVTGGTGRFADATGSGGATWACAYTPDLSGASSVSTWWGEIAY